MKTSLRSRVSAFVMALVMVFSLIPATAFAADSATYTQITSADELKSGGELVLVASFNGSYYALGTTIANKITATEVTTETDISTLPVWTAAAKGNGISLYNGTSYLGYNSSTNFMSSTTAAEWVITVGSAEDTFRLNAIGTTRYIAYQWNNGNFRFGAYAGSNASDTANYNFDLLIFKNTEFSSGGDGGEDPGETPEPDTPAEVVIDDGKYIIWEAGNGKAAAALDESKTYGYLPSTSVTLTDGVISGHSAANGWTIANVDGGVTIQDSYGRYIYMSGSYNSFNVTPDPTSGHIWTVAANADGTYTIANAETGKTLSYDSNYGSYGAYAEPSDATPSALTLTPYTEPVPDPEPDTPAEVVIDDGKYIIWEAGNGKAAAALDESKTYGYLPSTSVTLTDGVISGHSAANGWTIANVDGGVTIQDSYGRYIYMSGSYNSFNVATDPTSGHIWTVAANADGTYTIANAETGKTLSYDSNYGSYGAYAEPSDATPSALTLTPYTEPVPDPEPTPDPEPEVTYADKMTALPNDGDTIIIYNSGNAMGAAASGKKLSGVAAEVTEGKLPIADDMAQLLVTIDENGNYIFTLDGKYLTSAETGDGLSFADELTDCGKWTLVEVTTDATDGTWYIKNVGANYNGNYNQAMEYYKGFTTYGIKETAIYQMELFLAKAARKSGIVTELLDGDTVVIFNPANDMALSTEYSGFYNAGTAVTLTDGKLSGYTAADIWTVGVNADGTYTFSTADGKKLSMGASHSSMPLDDVNTSWEISPAATADCFYIKNAVRGNYIEWYADKNNWSSYYNNSNEALFAQMFYLVVESDDAPETTLPTAGSQVVIYNQNAKGVLAAENDTQSIENVMAQIEDGKARPANGAVVFTVSKNGNYFRFYNETYGYLCSNGTGNNAFYTKTASEDADWTLETLAGGYKMLSRTAKYNGTSAQYLEYYADSYKTYSFYATNKDGSAADTTIYEFHFYGLADGVNVNDGIVNMPVVDFGTLTDAYVGMDYNFSITVDAVFGVDGALEVTVNGETVTAGEDGSYTVPAEKVVGDKLAISVTGKDTKGVNIEGNAEVNVKDEPAIGNLTPAAGSETKDDKRPVISAEITNAKDGATVTMTVNGEAVEAVYADGKITYTPAADMADGRTSVTVTVVRADGKEATKSWSFIVGEAQYQLYFGQLHSHTTYSDGSGSLESALDYVKNLPDSANVDFVAFTDHSNYFDASGAANPEAALYDMSLATANSQNLWNQYKGAIADFNASQSDVVAIGGFEMTWSGGPGHINTFNTPGIVSRNNTTLNNKTSDAGMKAYYALLSQAEGADSLSQFNHPGSTFGTFTDFAYWDAVVDTRIQMVEVGNGEGQVGAGGYYPSYEYYTMALDKGWHVAPTNNQDNHKGKWGNANDARDVVLTDDFSEAGIYQAIRDMRMYSTEDKNLEIGYTVNGLLLGSSIAEVPEKLDVEVTVYDPDKSDSISKVEVIVNSGKVAYTWDDPAVLTTGSLSVTLDPTYSYYYIRVTEGDGDLAVTAPVWVGESLKLGISSVECATSTPVTDEELTLTTTLFNSESAAATVKSLTYAIKGGKVIGTDTTGYELGASSTLPITFNYTPTEARVMTVTVTAVVELEGEEYTFSMDIELDVQDADKLVYIGIDASHYNEYVNGNYKDSMGNFSQLAAEYNVRTVTLYESSDLIAACANEKYKALILTAPSRRSAEAQAADPLKVYTAEELAAINAFNQAGGVVILAGWSDHYENYPDVAAIKNMQPEEHMAATQNAVLEALGSSLRIGDDATYDDTYNGGQAYRLYFNTYGDSFLTEGVEVDAEHPHDRLYSEVFSHYGGASVYTVPSALPATVEPVVFGHSGTYSVDVDKDGLGGSSMPKYAYAEGDERLMIMATEQLEGRGLIIVSGAAFMSNFEVQATIEDSGSEKNYSNYKVCENLLAMINPTVITPIAEVQAQTEVGYKYTIEGIVTSNASGYDKDTAFFDCIYVQDATGGVCCFPVAGNYKIGDVVRVTGTTEFYQGEMELQVTSIEKIGETDPVEPKEVSAKEINDGTVLGQLITVKGHVDSFELANGLVQTIMVKDEKGDLVRVFIDGYITTAEDVKDLAVGATVTVTGIASYDNTFNAPEGPFPRIRIRDRADIVCGAVDPDYEAPATGDAFQPMLWLSLMALTTAAGAVMLLRRKEQQ